MQHTRQQIIDYLRENRKATSIELSLVLVTSAANIRHHLRYLKDEGMVYEVGQLTVRGRGRPQKLYSLTDIAMNDNLEVLADALIKTLLIDDSKAVQHINQTVENLIKNYQVPENKLEQLKKAVEKLTNMKYQASWEASPSGPRIILRNCPYLPIINNNPELCTLDEILISKMLMQPFQQRAKLERTPDGSPHCAFTNANVEQS